MPAVNLPNPAFRSLQFALLCILLTLGFSSTAAQQLQQSASLSPDNQTSGQAQAAPVTVDGNQLFSISGVTAFPAEQRAREVVQRIRSVARDHNFSTQNLRLLELPFGTQIRAGDLAIVTIFDSDARIENVPRQVLAGIYLQRIQQSINAYRNERQPKFLLEHAIYAILAGLFFLAGLFVGLKFVGRTRSALEQRYKDRVHGVEIQALQILNARHIWNLFLGAVAFLAIAILLMWAYATVYFILSQFPWTRGFSRNLFRFLLDPVKIIGGIFLDTIPDVIFLAFLGIVTYYVLKLIRLVFTALETDLIKLSGFDPEWAKPTYRLTRLLVIAFALVVAFPYIPGSNTQAFKGLSLFIGLIFSLGSTGLIGNLISGYSLTYRRVFKQGDRVKIGNNIGYVEKSTLMVTYLHTVKNEVIAVPNSQIINTEVINYSLLARNKGLILHTNVGIGYETPWRQVEAMLMEAATRTAGLLPEPRPFVLQKELGDFAVTYELNVYCDNPHGIEMLYTSLHQNILDVFNEFEVQIMTPAYETDPEQAKIVPKAQWYAAPAHPNGSKEGAVSERESAEISPAVSMDRG